MTALNRKHILLIEDTASLLTRYKENLRTESAAGKERETLEQIAKLSFAVRRALSRSALETMPAELAGLPVCEIEDETKPLFRNKNENDPPGFGTFIGSAPAMQKIYKQIKHVARSQATVFITGESGTGKEICAESIHQYSARADKPFVPVNCAALPRDLIESTLFGHIKGAFTGAIADRDGAVRQANGGTLFLDEIAEMNPDMQTKLLRFLQTFHFQKVGADRLEKADIRIICATNRNPAEEVRAGRLREDLFYRLHVLPLHLPPLRQRGGDIMIIARALLHRYNAEENKHFVGFAPEAEEALQSYDWPGNIRELQNVIRNIIVMHNDRQITPAMLPAALRHKKSAACSRTTPPPFTKIGEIRPLMEVEREAIEQAIRLCRGNVPKAAAALGVSPSTLYRKKAQWQE